MKLLKRNKLFLGVVLALAVSASTAFAGPIAYTIYTNYSLWLAATPDEHDVFGPPQNLGDLAVATATGSFGAPQGVFPAGINVWNDRVTVAGGEVTSFFDGDKDGQVPYYAYGGFWDFSPGGYGQGLTLTLDNGLSLSICGDVVNGCVGGAILVPDGTFFGVVTGPFTTFSITADGQAGVAETFDLSDLDLVHIPEPATMVSLGTGFLALGLWRRKTRA